MSSVEDEYFAKLAAEKKRKEIFDKYVHMHCPKDGAELKSVELEGVQIERCTVCHGIWLDKGELDELRHHDTHRGRSFFKMLFGDVAK